MKILAAVLIFGGIILFHEFGHFTVARLCKVTINEFAIGMGPAVFKREKNGTVYSVRALPLGGYVAMAGEDPDDPAAVDDPNAFPQKPLWQRVLILLAGSFNNILMGYVILVVLTIMNGYIGTTRIVHFEENSVSEGVLQLGDEIYSLNGNRVRTSNDVVYEFLRDEDGVIDVTVLREGKKVSMPVKFNLEDVEGQHIIEIDFRVAAVKPGIIDYVTYPVNWSLSIIKEIYGSFVDIVRGRFAVNQLAGPVGVVSVIGTATKYGIKNVLSLAAYLAINIGVFNLFPIPILDGGRIIIETIGRIFPHERVRRILNGTIAASMGLILLLFVYVTYNDIFRIFN